MTKIFLCTVLAACALPGHAETWHFEYRGFHDSVADRFLPDRRMSGSFAGADGDGDGTLARAEITSLIVNGFDFVACESASNEYWHCGAEAFTWRDGALSFTAGQYGSDPEGWVGGGQFYFSGEREYSYAFRPGLSEQWEYRWTDQTTLTISAAPEPGTWALLLAGLPLALLVARRRHKGAPDLAGSADQV